MNEHIQSLIIAVNSQIELHEERVKSLVQVRAALQNVCKHEFQIEGRDHVYVYEKCIVCGLSRKAE